jgi:16S rRNA (cytidine1402-2'-O)-methyltransferase
MSTSKEISPKAVVHLIPTLLSEEGIETIPSGTLLALQACRILFVENERTARRQIRKLLPSFDIDGRSWYRMDEDMSETKRAFGEALHSGLEIGILSEAGCPGIADPGQELVRMAQHEGVAIRPHTGPSSILLALMASGLNGQQFRFHGYLPVAPDTRRKAVRDLESDAWRTGCTHLFIETPYRNDAMVESLLSVCRPDTRLCIAVGITSSSENIRTLSVEAWKRHRPKIGKVPAIFLLGRE